MPSRRQVVNDLLGGKRSRPLPNGQGVVVGDGEDTSHHEDDLAKLKPYDVDHDWLVPNIAAIVRATRDEPIRGAQPCRTLRSKKIQPTF